MQVVYLAAPYRAKTINGIRSNIRVAEEAATKLWEMGFAVFTPHLNSGFMDGLVDDKYFLDAGIEFLKRSDGIVLVGNWRTSEGVQAELQVAHEYGTPVYLIDEYDKLIPCDLEAIQMPTITKTTVIVYEIQQVSLDAFVFDGDYRKIRGSGQYGKYKGFSCFNCNKKFVDGERVSLAFTNRGNRVLCHDCAVMFKGQLGEAIA